VSNLEGIITSVEVISSYQLVTIIINIYKPTVKKILQGFPEFMAKYSKYVDQISGVGAQFIEPNNNGFDKDTVEKYSK